MEEELARPNVCKLERASLGCQKHDPTYFEYLSPNQRAVAKMFTANITLIFARRFHPIKNYKTVHLIANVSCRNPPWVSSHVLQRTMASLGRARANVTALHRSRGLQTAVSSCAIVLNSDRIKETLRCAYNIQTEQQSVGATELPPRSECRTRHDVILTQSRNPRSLWPLSLSSSNPPSFYSVPLRVLVQTGG